MATRAALGGHPSNTERTDVEYALAAGAYVSLLFSPAVVLALTTVLVDAAALYVSFICAIALSAGLIGWLIIDRPGLAVELGRRDASWMLVVLPAGWFLVAFGNSAVGVEPPGVVVVLSVLATGVGTTLGGLLIVMSRTRYAAVGLAGADDRAQWEARWPRRWRRIALGAVVVSFVVGGIGIVADIVFGVERALELYYVSVFVLPLATPAFNYRTIRATDVGLVVEYPVARHLRPWSAVESYTLSEAALVVRFDAPWRPALRCDRRDIEDVSGTVAALDAALSS